MLPDSHYYPVCLDEDCVQGDSPPEAIIIPVEDGVPPCDFEYLNGYIKKYVSRVIRARGIHRCLLGWQGITSGLRYNVRRTLSEAVFDGVRKALSLPECTKQLQPQTEVGWRQRLVTQHEAAAYVVRCDSQPRSRPRVVGIHSTIAGAIAPNAEAEAEAKLQATTASASP